MCSTSAPRCLNNVRTTSHPRGGHRNQEGECAGCMRRPDSANAICSLGRRKLPRQRMVTLMGRFERMGELSGKGVSKRPLLGPLSGKKHKPLGKTEGQLYMQLPGTELERLPVSVPKQIVPELFSLSRMTPAPSPTPTQPQTDQSLGWFWECQFGEIEHIKWPEQLPPVPSLRFRLGT